MLHLRVPSDISWVTHATEHLDATLVDHAHCELKAAANALSMAARHSDDPVVVQTLTGIAREEIDHFQQVHDRLQARGLALGTPPTDPYVAALRRAHATVGPSPVAGDVAAAVDRLLTCALIEARSCERFGLLARALESKDRDLASFYSDLRTSEAHHYRVFVDLAIRTARAAETSVLDRLGMLAAAEGVIVETLAREGAQAAIHG